MHTRCRPRRPGPLSARWPATRFAAGKLTAAFLTVAACVASLAARPAMAVDIRELRLWRAPAPNRLLLDLSAPAEHALFELSNPSRVVIDVKNAALRASHDDLPLDGTPIAGVRSGIRRGNDLRIVLDLNEAVRPRSFSLGATERAADRLVIDLYDLELASPKPSVKKRAASDGRRDIVVAIDAGHGGEDPGAIGPGGLREKEVVFAMARELHALFDDEAGFAPTMIRSGDYYVSLKGRRDLARRREADIFVSIHADAFRDKRARGASVYALSTRGATSTTASTRMRMTNS